MRQIEQEAEAVMTKQHTTANRGEGNMTDEPEFLGRGNRAGPAAAG